MKLNELNQRAVDLMKKVKVRAEKPEEVKARHAHARKSIAANLAAGHITQAQHDKQMKAHLKEAFEEPMFTPQEAAALTKARQSGDPADWDVVDDRELNYKLYRIFLDSGEMPYGVAKARTGDPSNWIADRLERMSDMEFAGFIRNNTMPEHQPRLARGKGIGA